MNQPTQPGSEPSTRPADDKPLLCVVCKYDLRGTDPAGTCPECGRPVAHSLPKTKPLPPPDPTLPCVVCGYDLRGSDPQGSCPECGTWVYVSIRKNSIALADTAWALKVADGCHWLYLSVLLIIPITIAILGVPTAILYALSALPQVNISFSNLMMVSNLLGNAAYAWLLVKAQSGLLLPEPDSLKPASSESWRKVIVGTRLACISFIVLNLGGALAITLTELIPQSVFRKENSDTIFTALVVLLTIQSVIFMISLAGSARVMADIAMRLESDRHIRQGKTIHTFMKLCLGFALTMVLCFLFIIVLKDFAPLVCCLIPLILLVGGTIVFICMLQVLFTAADCRKTIRKLIEEEAARKLQGE